MEAQDLIYLVSCAVNEETPDPERIAAMDLEAVYELASRHMLAAAAAPALKAAGVQKDCFSKALEHSVLKNLTMDMEMEALFAEMDAAGIWHAPLKGIVLQHLYPVYGMRQMSDHDILFDPARAEDVKAIMEGLGFTTEEFGSGCHDVYHKEPVSNFEMHSALFALRDGEKLYEYYRDPGEKLLGDGCEKHFGPEDFYLYLTAHEYKHYSSEGTGLRSLLDIYVYLQKQDPDMSYVEAEAEKMGVPDFEAANRSLARRLFSGGELTEADREMLDIIISSGVYGSLEGRVQNRLAGSGNSKIRYAWERFIEPINKDSRYYQAFVEEFPFFYRHKILLPVLMVYRVFLRLKSGRVQREFKSLKKNKAKSV